MWTCTGNTCSPSLPSPPSLPLSLSRTSLRLLSQSRWRGHGCADEEEPGVNDTYSRAAALISRWNDGDSPVTPVLLLSLGLRRVSSRSLRGLRCVYGLTRNSPEIKQESSKRWFFCEHIRPGLQLHCFPQGPHLRRCVYRHFCACWRACALRRARWPERTGAAPTCGSSTQAKDSR